MKIYLAGPDIFEQDPITVGDRLKAICAKYGAEGLYPMDNLIHDGPDHAKRIREADMQMIQACDAIVANMIPFRGPSMDVGTAYEMGVGAALGKIIIGYTADMRSYAQKVMDSGLYSVTRGPDGQLRDHGGMLVEEFVSAPMIDNLMIACGIEKLCGTPEEAIKEAVEIFKAKKGGK